LQTRAAATRYLYFLGIVPAILVFFILRNIPESRHFAQVKL